MLITAEQYTEQSGGYVPMSRGGRRGQVLGHLLHTDMSGRSLCGLMTTDDMVDHDRKVPSDTRHCGRCDRSFAASQ